MKKIIFLDIDGVLNTDDFRDIHGNETLNPYLVENLASILFATGAHIVISSDWRFGNIQSIFDAMECKPFQNAPNISVLEKIISSVIDTTLDLEGGRR